MRSIGIATFAAVTLFAGIAPSIIASVAEADEPGPSFDCVRALTIDEKVICSSSNLRADDLDMAQKFKTLLGQLPAADQDALRKSQREWIKSRNKECGLNRETVWMPATQDRLVSCMLDAYRTRRDALSVYPDAPPAPPPIAAEQNTTPPSQIETLWTGAAADPAAAAKALRGINDPLAGMYADILEHMLNDDDKAFRDFAQGVLDVTGSDNSPGEVTIPCDLLVQNPRLLEMLHAYYGSNRDNFTPRADCSYESDRPAAVAHYLETLPESRANMATENGCGTLRYADYKEMRIVDLRLDRMPALYLAKDSRPTNGGDQSWPDLDSIPGRDARYWRPSTFIQFTQREIPAFKAARAALAQQYEQHFGFSADDALLAAHRAIWDQVGYLGIPEQSPVAPPAAIDAIVTGAPVDEVEQLLIQQETAAGGNDEGMRPDLALAAANRPEILRLLMKRGYEVNIAEETAGRTPLIEAAALGNVDVLLLLKEAGTNPNAATFTRSPDEIRAAWSATSFCGGWPEMESTNGSESPLMTAAQFGSLAAIKTLLAMGADKAAQDSRGFTAVDYLAVRNPALALADMTDAEMKEARGLLK